MKIVVLASAILGLAATSAMAASANGDCTYGSSAQAPAPMDQQQSNASDAVQSERPAPSAANEG